MASRIKRLIHRYNYRGNHRKHGHSMDYRAGHRAEHEDKGSMKQPASQNLRPWQAVARSTVAAAVGLLPVIPIIVDAFDLEAVPIAITAMTVGAAATRILATPEVETWLRANVPWFAAGAYDDVQSIESRGIYEQSTFGGSAGPGSEAEESNNFGPDSAV